MGPAVSKFILLRINIISMPEKTQQDDDLYIFYTKLVGFLVFIDDFTIQAKIMSSSLLCQI